MPHVVVLGCGFGGLAVARALARAPVALTVIDRTNHHLFQPLLYQVATAGLSAPAIAAPIRHILRRQRNATVLMAEVRALDAGGGWCCSTMGPNSATTFRSSPPARRTATSATRTGPRMRLD